MRHVGPGRVIGLLCHPRAILALMLSAVAAGYLAFHILTFTATWIHPETLDLVYGIATRNGLRARLSDFRNVLAFSEIDGRPRFLSTYLEILDVKLRLFIVQHLFPVPPGLSLGWLGSLGLAPLLLYKATKNFTANRRAALYATLLYVFSMSSLSGIVFRFHLGKPLTNLFIISVLFFCSVAHDVDHTPHRGYVRFSWRLALFLVYMTLCLFLDETALFAYLVLLVMPRPSPAVLVGTSGPARARLLALGGRDIAILSLPLVVFLITTFLIIPFVTHALGFATFDFTTFIFSYKNRPLWADFKLPNVFHNLHTNVLANLVPSQLYDPIDFDVLFKMRARGSRLGARLLLEMLALGLYGTLFYVAARRLTGAARVFAVRCVVCLVAFMIGQTILMVRHLQIANGYYYGCLFGVFYSMLVGTLLSVDGRFLATVSRAALAILLVIQVTNFHAVEKPFRAFHDNWTYQVFRERFPTLTMATPTSAENIRDIWAAWRDGRFADVQYHRAQPVQSTWLLRELALIEQYTRAR
jgi:hypothetical protein